MRRNKRDFGRLILIAIFLFIAVLLPNLINAISRAAGTLGTFAAGETGIKLCATISGGNEDALRFNVTNNQGFQADVVVPADTCKNIHTEAATYHIRQYVSQEYAIDSVSGGTISADDSDFVATASGQYSIVYSNTYSQKPYLHNFGYTSSATASSAVEITFDANGGTGTMAPQYFGLNAQRTLTANAFAKAGYAFDGWNTEADGSGTSYTDEQALTFSTGGELKLYAQWKKNNTPADVMEAEVNAPYQIDFTKRAIISDDITIANGNGVNKYTENNTDVYYYRGNVGNNNVIWANKCWKMIRTTSTGGTKMIYNGEPSDVVVGSDTVKQCLAAGLDSQITVVVNGSNEKTFTFSKDSYHTSPADSGYMYGTRVEYNTLSAENTGFIFSNNVTNVNGHYYLDTSSGQSITGTWADERLNANTRYHYFCTNGASDCDGTMIGYIYAFQNSETIYYLKLGGYDDIEALKTAMFANINDSYAKTMVETWFEQENLDGHIADSYNYEDDLEDTVFCNDRSLSFGALKSKDSDATPSQNGSPQSNYYGAYGRNFVKNAQNNYEPSLDCASKNDSFTKTETATTNGKLNHKIGLISADELTLAGHGSTGYDEASYLYTGRRMWTISPFSFESKYAQVNTAHTGMNDYWPAETSVGLRPVVSLKSGTTFADNGADGTTTNPYIVE